MKMMIVSIIICTRNRANSLGETLRSLKLCRFPQEFNTECLVVDNGSSDHTPAVVEAAKQDFPIPLKILSVKDRGQSRARNAGIRASRGKITLWTDDDVILPEDWVERMCGPIISGVADGVAGQVVLPTPREEALKKLGIWKLRGWFAATSYQGDQEPPAMTGANMAVGTHVFSMIGGFCEELGPGALGFADDTEFSDRMRANNLKIIAEPKCKVLHFFDMSRLSVESLHEIARKFGASGGYLSWHSQGIRLAGIRFWITGYARHVIPRNIALPLISIFWKNGTAPRLHLVSYKAMVQRNRVESTRPRKPPCGPQIVRGATASSEYSPPLKSLN